MSGNGVVWGRVRSRLRAFPERLAACGPEAAAYGRCVQASTAPGGHLRKDLCAQEFEALRSCFAAAVGGLPPPSPTSQPRLGGGIRWPSSPSSCGCWVPAGASDAARRPTTPRRATPAATELVHVNEGDTSLITRMGTGRRRVCKRFVTPCAAVAWGGCPNQPRPRAPSGAPLASLVFSTPRVCCVRSFNRWCPRTCRGVAWYPNFPRATTPFYRGCKDSP